MQQVAVVVVFAGVSLGVRAEEPWQEAATADALGRPLMVYSRDVKDSDVREVKGVGSFDAPPWVIKNVLDDVTRYKDFMPYTTVSDVVSQHDGFLVLYQRIKPPIIQDRDYVISMFDESQEDAAGKITWKKRWSESNALGPPPFDGVARLMINEGYWLLEDLDGGKHTKATYYIYTDSGGGLPALVMNVVNTQSVPDLYRAVAKTSADPRYTKTRPARPKMKTPVPPSPPAAAIAGTK